MFFLFFKHKTAYEMRISDWSSDVCSSVLARAVGGGRQGAGDEQMAVRRPAQIVGGEIDGDGLMLRRRTVAGQAHQLLGAEGRSEARGVGKACVSTGRFRWTQYP